jgi:hypothetical protein
VTSQIKAPALPDGSARSASADRGQCTKATARQIVAELNRVTDLLGQKFEEWQTLLADAYTRRAWAALGYASWGAFLDAEVPALRHLRLGRSARRELVTGLTDAGMSTRAIGAALGVNQSTVVRDQTSGDAPASPDGPTPRLAVEPHSDIVDAEIVEDHSAATQTPKKITGIDGKTYNSTPRDVPPPRRRRRPLPDAFEDATYELDKVVRRIVRLTADDRFPGHAAALREGRPGMYLDRAQQCLQRVRDALANAGVHPQVGSVLAAAAGGEDR